MISKIKSTIVCCITFTPITRFMKLRYATFECYPLPHLLMWFLLAITSASFSPNHLNTLSNLQSQWQSQISTNKQIHHQQIESLLNENVVSRNYNVNLLKRVELL
jgi:hypothetical protein